MNKIDKANHEWCTIRQLKERASNLTALKKCVGTLISPDEYKTICDLAMAKDDGFMGDMEDFIKDADTIKSFYDAGFINDRQRTILRGMAVSSLGSLMYVECLEYALRNIPTAHNLLKGGIYDMRGYERQVDVLIEYGDFILERRVEKSILIMIEVMCENDYVATSMEITKSRQHIVMTHRFHPDRVITVVRRKWPIIGYISRVAKDENGKKMRNYGEVRKYLTGK